MTIGIIGGQRSLLAFDGWEGKVTKSIQQGIESNPDAFHYQSAHIVVWPKANNEAFVVEDIYKLTCEIQVRTLLQHAFAEVSHDSTYKGPFKNDKDVLRRLAKTMALMEATDDYFCDIFKMLTDDTRMLANLVKELIRVFNCFMQFTQGQLDHATTDSALELYMIKPVLLDELEAFVENERLMLEKKINEKNGLLFTQPVIILLLYYFKEDQYFLKENWPYNHESLRSFFKTMGTSFENY